MPRKAVTNPNQFKLFMTGVEWQESIDRSTDGPIDRVWEQKEREARMPDYGTGSAHGAGTYDSLKKYGYQKSKAQFSFEDNQGNVHYHDDAPTIILEEDNRGELKKVQSEGHHRVAAAAAIERETGQPIFIPTRYVDNTPSAVAERRKALLR